MMEDPKSDDNISAKKRMRLLPKILFVIVLVLAISLGVGLYAIYNKQTVSHLTKKESLEKQYVAIKSEGPKTANDVAYYSKLASAAENAGKYDEAIAAFKKKEAINKDSMTYSNYTELARYYCRKNNVDESVKTIRYARDLSSTSADTKQSLSSLEENISKRGCKPWLMSYDAQ